MKLQDFAHWAEIVASTAVLVSLVVLIFEIRENTDSIRKASYEDLLESLREWRQQVASDADLHHLYYARRNNTTELTDEELNRVKIYFESLWLIYEQAYWANEYGDLGLEEWERFQYWICGGIIERREIWEDGPKAILSPAFVTYVENCRFGDRNDA